MNKKIKKYLRPLRYKLLVEKFINLFLLYASIFFTLCFIIIMASKFFAMPTYKLWVNKLFMLTMLVLVIHTIVDFPKMSRILYEADKLGFKERFITAIELSNSNSEVANLQRQDTLNMMKETNISKLYVINIKKQFLIIVIISMILNFGTFYIQTATSINNQMAAENIEEIREENKKLKEKLKDELKDSDIAKKDIDELIKNLDTKMKDAKNKKEALKALSVTKNELKKLQKKAETKLNKNSNARSSNNSKSKKQVDKAIKSINELGKKMAGKTISDYAFKSDGASSSENSKSSSEGSESDHSNCEKCGGDPNKSGSWSANGENSSGGTKAGEGSPKSGEGEGKGNASSEGKKAGKGLGGAGNSSSNADAGYSEASSSSGGKAKSEYKLGIYEALYDSRMLGGESEPEYVSGKKSSKGEKTYKDAQTMPTEAGEFKDYKELYTTYDEASGTNIDEMEIPNAMQEVVKGYFENLNE